MRTTHGTCLSLSPVAHGALTRLATTWGISRSAVVEIVLRHAGAALDTTVAALATWVRVQTAACHGDVPLGWTGEEDAHDTAGTKRQDTAPPCGGPRRALRAGMPETSGRHANGPHGLTGGPAGGPTGGNPKPDGHFQAPDLRP